MAQTGSSEEKNWRSKISLDCPFQPIVIKLFTHATLLMHNNYSNLFYYYNQHQDKYWPVILLMVIHLPVINYKMDMPSSHWSVPGQEVDHVSSNQSQISP